MGNFFLYSQRSHWIIIKQTCFVCQHSIRTKVIPKIKCCLFPTVCFRRTTVAYSRLICSCKGNCSISCICFLHTVRIHINTLNVSILPVNILVVFCPVRNIIPFPICVKFAAIFSNKIPNCSANRNFDWFIGRICYFIC